jgi:hypothetical protein
MQSIKVFGWLLVISVGFLYYFSGRFENPPMLPGDFYIKKAGRKIYIPISSAIALTIVLFLLLNWLF